jgi:hypothetical protein
LEAEAVEVLLEIHVEHLFKFPGLMEEMEQSESSGLEHLVHSQPPIPVMYKF